MLGTTVTHLVGDIHQPLHAIRLERGGNDYKITAMPLFDPGWRINNLHAFWDNAYRYDNVKGQITVVVPGLDRPRPSSLGYGPMADYAAILVREYLPGERKLAAVSDPAEWAAESARIACTFAFPVDGSHTLSAQYVHHAHDVACRRIVLAGCRLANLLNSIYAK